MIAECPSCRSRYDVAGHPGGTALVCRCGRQFPVPVGGPVGQALSCPQCGAACDPNSSRCRYCEATLAMTSCARCFGKAFVGARFCPYCAAPLLAPAAASAGAPTAEPRAGARVLSCRPRACPRCARGQPTGKVLLTSKLSSRAGATGDKPARDPVAFDECEACGGLFLETSVFQSVIRAAENDPEPAQAAAVAIAPAGLESTVIYLACPDCGRTMSRTNFGRQSGVIIDVCGAHGAWFDRDELRRVIEFVRAGGLARSRARHAEEERKLALEREGLKGELERHPHLHGPCVDDGARGVDLVDLVSDMISGILDLWH